MYKQPTSLLEQDNLAKSKKPRKKKAQTKPSKSASTKSDALSAPSKSVSKSTKKRVDSHGFQETEKVQQPTPTHTQAVHEKERDNAEAPELMEDSLSSPPKDYLPDATPKKCPQTPAPRIALKDLVRISEDGEPPVFAMASDASPEERIHWQVSPRGTPNPASQITPLTKRQNRLKRAKSSSPIGSPRATPIGKRHPGGGAMDPGKVMKTPQADPANEVWQRYANKSTSSHPSSAGVPAIPRLFAGHTASSLNLSPLGLRRSYSCGPDWPLLGAQNRMKRRKIGPSEDGIPVENMELEEYMAETEKVGAIGGRIRKREVKSRLNRVSMLLDKVHENLAKGTVQPNIPESSSPVMPDSSRGFGIPSSPTKSAMNRRTLPPQSPDTSVAKPPLFSDIDEYDEFDADIDMDMLEKVEEAAAAAFNEKNHKQSRASELKNDDFPDLKFKQLRTESPKITPAKTVQATKAIAAKAVPAKPAKAIAMPAEDDFDDEFDDGEDDLLYSVDVDNLLSQYDKKPTGTAPTTPLAKRNIQLDHVPRSTTPIDAADVVAEFGDVDFGDWDDDDDLDAADVNSGSIRRYVVLNTSEGGWDRRGREQPQKILQLREEKSDDDGGSGVERVVYLREDWYYVKAEPGDVVHVIGKFERISTTTYSCVVDNANNMLIVNPDFLVSSTTVADSFGCARRAVLQERVKAASDVTRPLVYGSMLHELFQSALAVDDFSDGFFEKEIEGLLGRALEQLYVLREEVEVAREYVRSKVGLIQHWAKVFVNATPKPDATAIDHRGTDRPNLCINKVLDIEEHVWSPMYGLKGNIDATVQARIRDRKSDRTITVPFEMKTGKNSTATIHRAQTMIYTLLLKDRYDVDIFCGLLYYMETSEIVRVPAIREELRGMIISRNELAWYAKNRDVLPPVIRQHACKSCFARTTCFVYHKGIEDGTAESSGLETQFEETTGHINEAHKAFIKHWDELLTKEERDMTRFRKELWTLTSKQREKRGRCFGDLVIVPESVVVAEEGSKINRFTYSLRKADGTKETSFLDSQIGVGEPIVISDEKGHFALAMGFVTAIRRGFVTVAVDRRLHNSRMREEGFDEEVNQVFTGIMTIGGGGAKKTPAGRPRGGGSGGFQKRQQQQEEIRFRLDKDELTSGMALVRNNLIQLLSNTSSERTRELIIELKPPVFKSTTAHIPDGMKEKLNSDQLNAVEKVMAAEDYALILGMPGTGKTTTIAHVIRSLVGQGKSVLLTSYTHTAVDNILLKIAGDGIPTLRLGNMNKIHPEVKEFAILAEAKRGSLAEIEEAYMRPKVVATTCLGINHHLFNQRIFDYCIVDEASQITLPVCLGPIRMAKKFILVGDHYQLPPLVRCEKAREGGLDVSLFKLLSDKHPEAVVSLEHQYRMCEEIMTLSNELIYDGRLKCGNEEVRRSCLRLEGLEGGLGGFHGVGEPGIGEEEMEECVGGMKCWIRDLLNENVKACFVNTDTVPAPQVQKGDRTENPTEAALAYQLVEALISCGLPPTSIGVISVYRAQIQLISHLLRHRPGVEMHTTDKFQGRDKDVVIISLVRSNDQGNVGNLLSDWRRVNVAFTRAKRKLLVLGSGGTLMKGSELLERFVRLMDGRGWVYNLPRGAHLAHPALEGGVGSGGGSPVKMKVEAKVKGEPGERQRERGNDENVPPGGGKVVGRIGAAKRGTIKGRALFGSRPVLGDIARDLGI